MVLENLEPKKVMHCFELLSAIPRASKHEKKVSDFLLNFAKERNLEVIQDEFLNIIIKKPATKGYENSAPIMLQGHMDMVPEANQGTKHNFETDPIELQIDGKFIRAKGTTLGADNGIAVAMMMAICDSNDIEHPALEMLITTDEEVSMTGAMSFDPKHFKARQMINIDTEEEGEIYVSCAGGVRTEFTIPIKTVPLQGECFTLSVRGLNGGHSGSQIHEQHGNSNKLLGRALDYLLVQSEFNLVSINGGSKENAIPRESDAIIAVNATDTTKLEKRIKDLSAILKKEFAVADPNVDLQLKSGSTKKSTMLDIDSTKKVIAALNTHPNGVYAMSLNIPGLVQTSLNTGIILDKDTSITLVALVRSSVASEMDALVQQLKSLAYLTGASINMVDPYPGWEFNPVSSLREVAVKVGKEVFGKDIDVKAVHAGLECGVISEKFKDGFDAISLGPNIYSPHTPDEHLDIKSVDTTYKWLLKILSAAK